MDLKNLKKVWDKLPSDNQLDENQLSEMLGKRSKTLMNRIDRNIKIGFGILLVLILTFALYDYQISPLLLSEPGNNPDIPKWLLFLRVFSKTLFFTTFIYFIIKYYRIKKSCDSVYDLKVTLHKIIETLKIYKTMFHLALISSLFAIGTGFALGLYNGFLEKANEKGIPLAEIQKNEIAIWILIGLLILTVITGTVFLFLQWGFLKLYGNYIQKLKLTLSELQEIEE